MYLSRFFLRFSLKITIIAVFGMIALCASSTLPAMDSSLLISTTLVLAFFVGQVLLVKGLFQTGRNLIQFYLSASAIGLTLWLSLLSLDIYPSLIGITFVGTSGISIFFTLAVTMVMGLVRFKRYSFLSVGPFLICICFFLLARSQWFIPQLADSINDWQFQRNLSEYSSIVQSVKNGLIPTTPVFRLVDILPKEAIPSGVTGIRAASWKPDGLVVAFTISSDKVRLRKGYIFEGLSDSDPRASAFIKGNKFRRLRKVFDEWYSFEE